MSDEKISVEISELPNLSNPQLICGLPGSGYVGKLAVDYLIDKLQAKQFANIYSSSFPPQVSIREDGTLDLVKNTLYSAKINSQELIFLTGDAQPVSAQGEYALTDEIINLCKKLNVKKIFTLAAYITGKFSKSPKVYGTSTSSDIIKQFSEYDVSTMNRGNITGMNGVIIGIAKRSSIPGICLLGETSGYVIDANASKAVLESLSKILNITIDMSELEQRAKDTEEIIKTLQAQAASKGSQEQIPQFRPSDDKSLGYIS
ncbi:proteasome assembly chaperone family protein [Nitrosopumilus sp. b1]|mgnify:CR=1 FL=1|uniref:proteasome assembly chaperone family protein n=1 Tax=Nitrosopumilus sp. b1 TaxID=2109907 RepID=UPI0015F38596|nr:proteasome assembly chaperone family protein [Nitrosopumilus sp. b1]